MAAESDLEWAARRYAISFGGGLHKTKFAGRRGCPDRLLVVPSSDGVPGSAAVAFVEFKAPGETPEPHQELVHQELRREGLRVEVIDNFNDFRVLVGELKNAADRG